MKITEQNPFSLAGKTVLITGASSGLGKAIAIEASRLGATVLVSGRDAARLDTTLGQLDGDGHSVLAADITDEEQLKNLVKELPPLDGVVLCAGISGLTALQFASRKKFESMFETNFFSNVELLRLLVKSKKLSAGASVVTLASIGGVRDITIGKGMYGSSKAALSACMKYYAKELASKGIRVNCICPGMILTELADKVGYAREDLDNDLKTYPLGRFGSPEDVAYSAVYFLSDASAWVTGIDFIIDGGHTL